jgi:hypothetical protein
MKLRFALASCFTALALLGGAGCPPTVPEPPPVEGEVEEPPPNEGEGEVAFAPTPGTTWQWQLQSGIDLSFDVDVYDVDMVEAGDGELAQLRAGGRQIICYFSAGTFEDFRDDSERFPVEARGLPLEEPFEDELWLDIRDPAVRAVIADRIALAARRGCDAVEPDNVDAFANDNGFGLTAADQLDFNRFVARTAHEHGLSVGLKNDVAQLAELEPDFDWALNEECFIFEECEAYEDTFIAANKAVFHAEYVDDEQLEAVCAVTKPLRLSTILKNIELDARATPCP